MNPHDALKQSMRSIDNYKAKNIVQYYISETIKLSIITGPLYCISSNLQYLDKSLFESAKHTSDGKFIRNFPLSSILRPFRPSYYSGYKDCIVNLYKQGVGGLYKGNLIRLLYFGLTSEVKMRLDLYYGKYIGSKRLIREIVMFSIADILLHPLLFIESRYSIQNRRKGFRIYNNMFSVLKYSWRELYNGSLYCIPRNLIFASCMNLYFINPSTYMNIFSVFLAHFLSYPILTVQRNVIYHSKYIDYLPKPEGIGFRSLLSEYGIGGLYRGFIAYSISTALWHVYVPIAAKKKLFESMFEDGGAFKLKNVFEDTEEYED